MLACLLKERNFGRPILKPKTTAAIFLGDAGHLPRIIFGASRRPSSPDFPADPSHPFVPSAAEIASMI
jgi:hypothetical protein